MRFQETMTREPLVFAEGAVIERLRRDPDVDLDPYVAHAGFVYQAQATDALRRVYQEYLDIGKRYDVPMVALAPTWRANPERLAQAGLGSVREVNRDCVRFLTGLVGELGGYAKQVLVGGLMGCRGDAYDPHEALSAEQAAAFHRPQAQALAEAGVDFIMASTLPALSEALGMAAAMAAATAAFDVPCVLSFLVRPTGTLLDGTPLHQAISTIDTAVHPQPFAYMINCVHPTIFEQALAHERQASDVVVERVVGHCRPIPRRGLPRSWRVSLVWMAKSHPRLPTTCSACTTGLESRYWADAAEPMVAT